MKHNMTVFLDLDGVVVDWLGAMLNNLGIGQTKEVRQKIIDDYDALEKLVGRDEVDRVIEEAGHKFWAELEFLPWGQRLVETVQTASDGNLAFLTSPGKWAEGAKGKMIWHQKHYPNIPLIICRRKFWVAGPNKYLIDDDPKQVETFSREGGFVYHWPNQYQLIADNSALDEIETLTYDINKVFDVMDR